MTERPEDRINQNVETIASLHARKEEQVSRHQRGIERLTWALGRPRTLYVIALVCGGWMTFNGLASRLGVRAVDPPPFDILQGVVGLAALFMTTVVLTTQNRQTKQAEQRVHLDLQVNLLAEQKIAKVIALLEELRRDMPTVPNRVDPVADVMTEPVDPQAVMKALEETFDAKEPEPEEATASPEDLPSVPGERAPTPRHGVSGAPNMLSRQGPSRRI